MTQKKLNLEVALRESIPPPPLQYVSPRAQKRLKKEMQAKSTHGAGSLEEHRQPQ